MSSVYVSVVAGGSVTVHCEDGATVQDILNQANLQIPENAEVHVNGNEADLDTPVADSDSIDISGRAKGNAGKITVTRVPADPVVVNIPDNAAYTVEEVATFAGLREVDITNMAASINGEPAELDDAVEDGDSVDFAPNSKGNK